MNEIYIHIILNHIPMFVILFGIGSLTLSFWPKFAILKTIAYILLFVGGISTKVVEYTGEQAEEKVEEMQGFDHDLIEHHEHEGERAANLAIVLGIIALIGWVAKIKEQSWEKWVSYALVLFSLITLLQLLNTAKSGGKISHPEAYDATELVPDHRQDD